MNIKKSLRLIISINPEIKVGDFVKLYDGSALSINADKHSNFADSDFYIVYDYPKLGFNDKLKSYSWKVVEIGVENRIVTTGEDWAYLQDIVIEYNHIQFRTSSDMVSKL